MASSGVPVNKVYNYYGGMSIAVTFSQLSILTSKVTQKLHQKSIHQLSNNCQRNARVTSTFECQSGQLTKHGSTGHK